jgi:hypothetical protein
VPEVAEEPVGQPVPVVALAGRNGTVEIVAEVAHVDVEQPVAVEVEDGRRAAHQALPAESGSDRDVLEAGIPEVAVEAVVVVRVRDQHVGSPVVVEVGK